MKNGYTLYCGSHSKLEITFQDIDVVTIDLGPADADDNRGYGVEIPYADFREFMKDVGRQMFDISGEN